MNRLRYPYKLALIYLLFILPLFAFLFLLISEINAQIDFADKEIQGNRYFRPLHSLLEHALQARLTTPSFDVRKITSQSEHSSMQTQIDDDFRALEAIDQELGTVMETTQGLAKLQSKWRLLRDLQSELKPADRHDLCAQIIQDIRWLISQVGDSSNLVLDPNLDTYYPINVLLLKLPEVDDRLVQAQWLDQAALAKKSLNQDEHELLISLHGVIRSNLTEILKGVDVAFRNNPAGNLKPTLEDPLKDFARDVSAVLTVMDDKVPRVPALAGTVDPAAFDFQVEQAVRSSARLWNLAVIEVDNLLHARINRFARRKYLIEAVSLCSLLLIAYLLVGFYGSVMRTVSSLDAASRRMIEGDLLVQVPLETRDELTQVVQSFNNIADRLRAERDQTQEVNDELEAFAYSVSHDLRAPLRALQGISQALLEDYGSQMDVTAQDYSRRLVAAAAEMENLIQDLLTYSRLSRTEMRLGSVELTDAIAKAQEQIAADIQESQAEIAVARPKFTVRAHSATLVQVLANLLSNSVKFVEKGVKPLISVTAQQHEGRVRLCIEDNGIGIAPEHQERIFRVFERLHGVETYPGSGIGLAIVRKGVSRMGGRFGVISKAGQGSRFWIELPGEEEQANES